jgi:hypothetical protein
LSTSLPREQPGEIFADPHGGDEGDQDGRHKILENQDGQDEFGFRVGEPFLLLQHFG